MGQFWGKLGQFWVNSGTTWGNIGSKNAVLAPIFPNYLYSINLKGKYGKYIDLQEFVLNSFLINYPALYKVVHQRLERASGAGDVTALCTNTLAS